MDSESEEQLVDLLKEIQEQSVRKYFEV